jgi:hypothetical protein
MVGSRRSAVESLQCELIELSGDFFSSLIQIQLFRKGNLWATSSAKTAMYRPLELRA